MNRDVHEIVGIGRGLLCPAGLGLSLAEAKAIIGGIFFRSPKHTKPTYLAAKTFVRVIDAGSFSSAAKQLRVGQNRPFPRPRK
jgi:hypothetical protein